MDPTNAPRWHPAEPGNARQGLGRVQVGGTNRICPQCQIPERVTSGLQQTVVAAQAQQGFQFVARELSTHGIEGVFGETTPFWVAD